MYSGLLTLIVCWNVGVEQAHVDHASRSTSNDVLQVLVSNLTTGLQDSMRNSMNNSFADQPSVACCLELGLANLSLRLLCQKLTPSNGSISSSMPSCLNSETWYQFQAVILYTASTGPEHKLASEQVSIYLYTFSVVCAGVFLLCLCAAAMFLMRRLIHRQWFRKLYVSEITDYERPRYENISEQLSSSSATVTKDRQEATNKSDSGKEHCQNIPSNLSQCTSASCVSRVAMKSNWSATNSSIKESSLNDDNDDSSEGISFDDSGKDSGSLYITPSHKTTSSDATPLNSKRPRYKRQRPSNATRPAPADGSSARQDVPPVDRGETSNTSRADVFRSKHRVHVTWQDPHAHMKNVTEELNNRQRKLPQNDNDYNRYPFRHPIILSRNFVSQQTLAFHGKLQLDSKRVEDTDPHVRQHYDNKHFYSESDLDEVCSESTTSLNRFSTVAHANRDVARASVCSSSTDGAHGVRAMFRTYSRLGSIDLSSYMSSVSNRSHAV